MLFAGNNLPCVGFSFPNHALKKDRTVDVSKNVQHIIFRETSVIIPIHKKGDKRKCTNYRGISLISVPGKVYAKCLEKKCREIVEPKLMDAQCGFRPGRSTMDQIFALQQIFEKSWEYAKEVHACFVDLEKT